MNAKERVAKLEQARRLIEQVRDSLSLDSSVCECCGLTKYHNFDQYQVREQLNAAINRLTKTGERIANDSHLFNS